MSARIRIADESLEFRDLVLSASEATGASILEGAGLQDPNAILLQRLGTGDLETIRPHEKPDLGAGNEFIVGVGDRTYIFTLDGAEMVWSSARISGAILRKLARLSDDVELVLVRSDGEQEVIDDGALVDLTRPGVEKLVTRVRKWKLRVQAVTLEFTVPMVKVADAMREAGFDPTKAWNIFLLVAGQPKQEVDVNYVVDLRTPGIERIRLMQRNVDNGEATIEPAASVRAAACRHQVPGWHGAEVGDCESRRAQMVAGARLRAASGLPAAQGDPRARNPEGLPAGANRHVLLRAGRVAQRWRWDSEHAHHGGDRRGDLPGMVAPPHGSPQVGSEHRQRRHALRARGALACPGVR